MRVVIEGVDPVLLKFFDEYKDVLERVNVRVDIDISNRSISFESESIISGRWIDDRSFEIVTDPDPKILSSFDSLKPFVVVLYSVEVMREDAVKVKFRDPSIHIIARNIHRESVRCPFCGFEQEYYLCQIPYVYPPKCKCGAKVYLEVGDVCDVIETLFYDFDFDGDVKIVNNDKVETADGRVIAIRIEEDEECREMELCDWLIFSI